MTVARLRDGFGFDGVVFNQAVCPGETTECTRRGLKQGMEFGFRRGGGGKVRIRVRRVSLPLGG